MSTFDLSCRYGEMHVGWRCSPSPAHVSVGDQVYDGSKAPAYSLAWHFHNCLHYIFGLASPNPNGFDK